MFVLVFVCVTFDSRNIAQTSNVPARREHSPLHNGLGLTPAAAVCLARRHARPINALGDDQPTLSALYYDLFTSYADMKHVAMHAGLDQKEQ